MRSRPRGREEQERHGYSTEFAVGVTAASATVLVPILVPICRILGIDLVHFGLVMVLNLMIGSLHPPMGAVLFVLPRVARLSFERTTISILSWLLPLLGTLAICTYVPEVVLWMLRRFYSG